MDPVKKWPSLVGLYSSQAGSGKSEVAKMLWHRGFEPVKFAGPLKAMTRGLLASMSISYRLIERMVEGDLKETVIPGFETITPRHLMQTLGTDWGREAVDTKLWEKVAMATAQQMIDAGARVVIDDMRFPNEFEAIRAAGGVTVRVDRPNPSRAGYSRYEGLLDDFEFDMTIVNDGTLEDLAKRVLDRFP